MRKGIKMDTELDNNEAIKQKNGPRKGKKIKFTGTDTADDDEPLKKKRKSLQTEEDDDDTHVEKALCKRERVKSTCTVSARMKQVVGQMVLCSQEEYNIAMQQTTIFAFKSIQSEIVSCFLEEMRRENAPLMQNKTGLLQLVDDAYERSQSLIMIHNNDVIA